MSLRTRLSIATVAGLLAAAATITPAAALDDWDPSGGNGTSRQDPNGGNGGNGNGNQGQNSWNGGSGGNGGGGNGNQDPNSWNGGSNNHNNNDSSLYRGVVTADTLALRSAPNRGSQIIRYAHRGDEVKIFCKTGGETVQGNPLWYLLTDGTWAWGAARYIDNVGPAPRWC
ncbi:SH3 domain-containing protein [Streptomyces sp. Ag82_O1-12]|uniref:SH3 domain-containing protein n=1 Tax=unclassified Streptomyces TaxID=2593676 RepID=UPI000BDC79F8|nr:MULTISPECIES: SH3 domain-containing protein [unclassified Streptomyces]SMQ18877.1 SH3 domain-containing protein [Streptomyces sp. Ag82_O1-12]SOD47917.1 SH3 domain-containing protein [Streptomyces sp. Ag82_G6-1]